jgi:hypothetical protein
VNLENYKAYATSEAEAQTIVRQVNSDNGEKVVSYRQIPYSPTLWEVLIHAEWKTA